MDDALSAISGVTSVDVDSGKTPEGLATRSEFGIGTTKPSDSPLTRLSRWLDGQALSQTQSALDNTEIAIAKLRDDVDWLLMFVYGLIGFSLILLIFRR